MLTRPQNENDASFGLLELARILGKRDRESIESVEEWDRLVEIAVRSRLVAALTAALEDSGATRIPTRVRDALSQLSAERSLQAIHQVQQLHSVLDLLRSRDIAVVVYKGVTLGQLAFGSLGARETSDLDLLVAPRDYAKAYHALLSDGFECDYPRPTRHMFRQSYEISLLHPSRRIYVDLHRAFLPACYPFALDVSTITPYSVSLLGREVATLEPTEHLLVLCAHGSKHGWREPRWVYDLHQLCGRHAIDWERLRRLARTHGATGSVAVGLELTRRLFGTAVPTWLPEQRLLERTLRQLGTSEHSGMARHRYQWMVADNWFHRCRYLFWTLFCPHQRDLDFVDLPTSLWPLYYLLRPFRTGYERLFGRLSSRG